jgi:hypothetical protein
VIEAGLGPVSELPAGGEVETPAIEGASAFALWASFKEASSGTAAIRFGSGSFRTEAATSG